MEDSYEFFENVLLRLLAIDATGEPKYVFLHRDFGIPDDFEILSKNHVILFETRIRNHAIPFLLFMTRWRDHWCDKTAYDSLHKMFGKQHSSTVDVENQSILHNIHWLNGSEIPRYSIIYTLEDVFEGNIGLKKCDYSDNIMVKPAGRETS